MVSKSEQIDQLAAALAKVQGAIQHAAKGSSNPFFKSKYADLTAVINAVRPYFAAENFSFVQSQTDKGGGVSVVTTLLLHNSGQWLEVDAVTIASPRETKEGQKPADAQSWGSANTYGRRYGLQAVAGISAEVDDDANSATGRI